jgi:hypothetical protein
VGSRARALFREPTFATERHVLSLPMLEGPAAGPLVARVVADLERRPPVLFVVNRARLGFDPRPTGESALRGHPILAWASLRYVPMAGSADRGLFTVFVRRGSRLDVARLDHATARSPFP